MTALSVSPAYPIFTDRAGQPLENGYIWIGAANQPPQTNPIAVFWDAALTQPAAQPVRTINGYPSNSGTPGRLYVGSDYSLMVQDAKGSVVYSAPASTQRLGDISSSEVIFVQAGAGAANRTIQDKAREFLSVKDRGAVGNGIADDTAAIQLAINEAIKCISRPGRTESRLLCCFRQTRISLARDGEKRLLLSMRLSTDLALFIHRKQRCGQTYAICRFKEQREHWGR